MVSDHIKVINKLSKPLSMVDCLRSRWHVVAEIVDRRSRLHLGSALRTSEFVCLIGSDEGHACDMLDSIKTELDSNELLLADFPEVCFPIQALDESQIARMVSSIKANARRFGWTAKEVVLPTIEGSGASGAIIKVEA